MMAYDVAQLPPIVDQTFWSDYLGLPMGTYWGSNEPTPDYADVLMARANAIQPLNALGKKDPTNGKIGFVGLGPSNGEVYFDVFAVRWSELSAKPSVVFVSAAQGRINGPGSMGHVPNVADGTTQYWTDVTDYVADSGLTMAQVQVVIWMPITANPASAYDTVVPLEFISAEADMIEAAYDVIWAKFPNCRLIFFWGRESGKWTDEGTQPSKNPEPFAHDNSWSRSTVINRLQTGQISVSGKPAIAALPEFDLWTQGETPRQLDGLVWTQDMFVVDDYVHATVEAAGSVFDTQFVPVFTSHELFAPLREPLLLADAGAVE